MNSSKHLSENLQALGSEKTAYSYDAPRSALLETFPSPTADNALNPHSAAQTLQIRCPEFTSLCPKTGQPDFATIVIEYEADKVCVESKSLKLYLGSFRMSGEFHEACVNRICNDLVTLLDPKWIMVRGEFTPRGGIPFWPTSTWHRRHEGFGAIGHDLQAPGLNMAYEG
jgi:7-cyano-7-deazaguanine reductase